MCSAEYVTIGVWKLFRGEYVGVYNILYRYDVIYYGGIVESYDEIEGES